MNTNTRPAAVSHYKPQLSRADTLPSLELAPASFGTRESNVAMKTSQYGQEPVTSSADAEEVRALFMRAMEGWNVGSGEAFAAPFADDVEFIAFDGTRFRGRAELVSFHDPLFKTHLRGTRLVGGVTDVRFLGNDVALIHARCGTVLRGKSKPAPARDSIQTLVAARRDGRWQFVAFQNTRVRPIGRNLLGTLMWLVSDWLWKWCLPRERSRPDASWSVRMRMSRYFVGGPVAARRAAR